MNATFLALHSFTHRPRTETYSPFGRTLILTANITWCKPRTKSQIYTPRHGHAISGQYLARPTPDVDVQGSADEPAPEGALLRRPGVNDVIPATITNVTKRGTFADISHCHAPHRAPVPGPGPGTGVVLLGGHRKVMVIKDSPRLSLKKTLPAQEVKANGQRVLQEEIEDAFDTETSSQLCCHTEREIETEWFQF